MTNLKRLYYVDKEMRDIMKEYYLMKRNHTDLVIFLEDYNRYNVEIFRVY